MARIFVWRDLQSTFVSGVHNHLQSRVLYVAYMEISKHDLPGDIWYHDAFISSQTCAFEIEKGDAAVCVHDGFWFAYSYPLNT